MRFRRNDSTTATQLTPASTPMATAAVCNVWREKCRLHPALGPDTEPGADFIVEAIADALVVSLEQPDEPRPGFEALTRAFAVSCISSEVALAELVCLRDAFTETFTSASHPRLDARTTSELEAVIDRTMIASVTFLSTQLRGQALTDELTNLGNRRAFEHDLQSERARSRRHGEKLTVAMLDVDGLKLINDRQGHPAGDRALQDVGRALAAVGRVEDRSYRLGGDEFASLLTTESPPEPGIFLARLSAAGAPPCSVGIATSPDDPLDYLVHLADARLYEGRRQRRIERDWINDASTARVFDGSSHDDDGSE